MKELTPFLHVKIISISSANGLPIVHVQWGLDLDEIFFSAFCSAIHTFAINVLQGRVITAVDMADMKLVFEKERDMIFVIGIETCVSKDLARELLQQVKERFYEWCDTCSLSTANEDTLKGLDEFQQFADYLSNDFWDGDKGDLVVEEAISADTGLKKLNKGQVKLLRLIESNPGVEIDEKKLTELSGYKLRTVKRYLKALREYGLV